MEMLMKVYFWRYVHRLMFLCVLSVWWKYEEQFLKKFLVQEDGLASGKTQKDVVSALPPQWVDYVDGVNSIVDEIGRLMTNLGSLHSSRLGSVFGQDNDDMEINIDKITRDITSKKRL